MRLHFTHAYISTHFLDIFKSFKALLDIPVSMPRALLQRHDLPSVAEQNQIFTDNHAALLYLIEKGVIVLMKEGDDCWVEGCRCKIGKVDLESRRLRYRCQTLRGKSRHERSLFQGTFFHGIKIELRTVLHILFLCIQGSKASQIVHQTGVSPKTATNWIAHYFQVIEYDITNAEPDTVMIGGPGYEVQVDESKFGKVQYCAAGPIGHPVKGVWVLGGVESKFNGIPVRQGNMFLVKVEKRDAATLIYEIAKFVRPGTLIVTDCWRGYNDEKLRQIGMMHDTVNHSVCFVNEYGVHTNTIEGNWAGLKLKIDRRYRAKKYIEEHLLHQMWLRRFAATKWHRLLFAIKNVKYTDNEEVGLEQPLLPDFDEIEAHQIAIHPFIFYSRPYLQHCRFIMNKYLLPWLPHVCIAVLSVVLTLTVKFIYDVYYLI